jgi:dTDP-4-amino-4,6-dideoxygalactose transaminase
MLLPVHLYGRVADMAAIRALGEARGLTVLEDACQAHGANRDGIRAGTAGRAGAFSFYPGKNLGALGDAGALVTDDGELATAIRGLREHGQRSKYHHEAVGWTARLDTIQAAALLRKLPHLDNWNAQRRDAADLYDEGLAGVGDLVLPDTTDRGQVWHLYVVRTADPAGLAAHLGDRGIGTGRHYPEPPHLSGAYADLGLPAGSFPVAERMAREVLSLPLFPGITETQVGWVVDAVRSWFDRE